MDCHNNLAKILNRTVHSTVHIHLLRPHTRFPGQATHPISKAVTYLKTGGKDRSYILVYVLFLHALNPIFKANGGRACQQGPAKIIIIKKCLHSSEIFTR